jgi:signal transduction histidine kinase
VAQAAEQRSVSKRSTRSASGQALLPRLESILVLVTLAFSTLFGLAGLMLVGPAVLVPLIFPLVGAAVLNSLLLWLDRREAPEWVVTWGARLGNLAFLTMGIHLTGGLASPFFSLYAVYIVAGGLRDGWRGAGRSFALSFSSWVGLALTAPPLDVQAWTQAAMLVSAFVGIALAVGALAGRHSGFPRESLQRHRELTFLREAGQALGASLDPQEVLATTLARVNELLDVEAASLALLDQATGRITFELAIGGGDDSVKGLRMEPGQGIVGQVIQTGTPVLVPDVEADPRWYDGVDRISGYRTRSLVCVPLRVKGQIIGALEVLNKRDGPFTVEDQQLLSSLAGLAAQSIENARLHDQIRQHVERLQDAYEEVRKLDELKSDFIRNVSHELRTPLALMEGYLELILDGQLGSLRDQQRQGLSVVAEKTTHLSRMVSDIISLQTIGAMGFDLEVLCAASLVRATVDAARPKAQRARICLELDLLCAPDLLRVKGDAKRLGQVFHHLLDNAIKFSPNGGTVQLRVDREEQMVCVQVQDEGIGLPSDQWERIFDRFYQVDGSSSRSYGGTGLGLALVREVVEAHGGAVWVESEGVPGRGCTFSVYLPAYNGQTVA